MKRIGILSDTHSWLNPSIINAFAGVDEIWHAGDIGNVAVADELARHKTLRAVYGNIDDARVRSIFPALLNFETEGIRVLMMHIAGYPGHYTSEALSLIRRIRPGLLVCGHSHILRIIYDKEHEMLTINPGAAGKYGFHRKITCVRFTVANGNFSDMEIIELDRAASPEAVG